jgi:hypothetical protein
LVVHPNASLNHWKGRDSHDEDFLCGRSSSAASAGLNDNALNAESSTDTAMVSANCL